jgi:aspartyl-tRNA(Asn)/glutamyl-tRNA(Gln) amidotransferase subunit B
LPLELDADWVADIKAGLPELPDEKRARFMADYGLTPYDAAVLVAERETAEYFETVAQGRDGKLAANWVTGELFGLLNREARAMADSPVTAEDLGGLIDLIDDGTLSNRLAKDVFEEMAASGKAAALVVEEKGLKQITDTGAIEAEVDKAIAAGPDQVAQFKAGNEKVLGWFVGQVMKATGGKANPGAVNEILRKKLAG